jgi:hypothetical protein
MTMVFDGNAPCAKALWAAISDRAAIAAELANVLTFMNFLRI